MKAFFKKSKADSFTRLRCHSFHLRQSLLLKYEIPIWTRKVRIHEKLRVKLKTLQVQFAHLSERINTAGLLIRVGGATERSFRKMELLEFEEQEENKRKKTEIRFHQLQLYLWEWRLFDKLISVFYPFLTSQWRGSKIGDCRCSCWTTAAKKLSVNFC